MRVLLQRVSAGSVQVNGEVTGEIQRGFVALVGVTQADTDAVAEKLALKTANLRVFSDDDGKMNLSLLDVDGGVLVVSQFTLYANARKGRRPSYIQAARPDQAEPLVQRFAESPRPSRCSTGRAWRLRRADAGRDPQRWTSDNHAGQRSALEPAKECARQIRQRKTGDPFGSPVEV